MLSAHWRQLDFPSFLVSIVVDLSELKFFMSSPITPEVALATLQATALSTRCHNAFFRQKQLKSLHDALRNTSNAIRDAIKHDTHVSDEEATTEVALVLDLVKEHYNSIDAKKELEAEYRIKNGKDASDRREPWGVAYIEPQKSHTPFFSAISPLSAALAAGSCVALKLENNLRSLPSLLRKLLTEALESDTFIVISSDPPSEPLSACLQIFQEKQVSQPTYSQHISPQGKVVAVVDRTADLASAAEQLVTARFAFGGTSPYAPDVVLVNEFINKEFLEHVLKHSLRFLAGAGGISNGSTNAREQKKSSRVAETFQTLSESNSWKVNVITQGDNGAIVELTDLMALPSKSQQPVFCVSPITSLEHAISLVDEDLDPQATLLAAYHFGTPSAGKYLSQFIYADVSFANHIPFRLLLGPAAAISQSFDIEKRYTTQHFTRVSPAYIVAPTSQSSMSKVLLSKDSKAATELLGKATQEIKEKKRAESIAIGYFEQGILIGLGFYGIPILTCLGATIFFGIRAGLRRWAFV
ncbi:ALDH-like protein [Stemphylium lycopersici]|uniref:ALDH-like protein n=1 Tax=Stemphylium lycopersici TaxID=183478 RepID=A0A364MX60_STELY|nr:ALDH-like protein [Stemphylium lycopersici]